MKKILFVMVMFICSFCFAGVVNADYKEGNWNKVECFKSTDVEKYADLAITLGNSASDYSFDKTTGVFTLKGISYTDLSDEAKNAGKFYIAQNQELMGYLLGNDAITNAGFKSVAGDNDVCIILKKATNSSSGGVPTDPVSSNGSSNNDSNNGSNSNSNSNSSTSNSGDSNYATDSESVKTSSNPSTGLNDYVLYLLPILLIGGSLLVLRNRLG